MIPKRDYYRAIRRIESFIEPDIARAVALGDAEMGQLSKLDMGFNFLHSVVCFSRDPKLIRDQVMSVLLASRETTAATMSWAMYELSHYPDAWARLRAEVLATLGTERRPTYEELKRLRSIKNIFNETLRLHPAVPLSMRQALKTTTIPGLPDEPDVVLLKGDTVTINTFGLHRRRDLYPPVSDEFADPDVFSPDRWEHWTPRAWSYIPFGGGPRICAGQTFALAEAAYCCRWRPAHGRGSAAG